MIKVMVIDDEPIVRLAIKSLVNWEDNGFILKYEAANGRQALKLLEEDPDMDIIVTDINMPVMNGLEFIAAVKESGLTPTIVVLSAYNDYNLVRQAFKLGVSDYVLKTEMEPESILGLLKDIAERIRERKAAAGTSPEAADLGYMKERLLADLIGGTAPEDSEARLSELGMRIHRNNLVVCFLWVNDYQMVSERYDNNTLNSFINSVRNAVNQVLAQIGNGEILSVSPQEYAVVLSFKGVSASSTRNRMNEILGQIRHSLANYVSIGVSIGVSGIRDGLGNIGELYRQAEANARYRFVLGKGRIIGPEDVSEIAGSAGDGIIGREAGLIGALREADEVKAGRELESLFDIIRKSMLGRSIDRVYSSYMELLFIMIKFLNEIGEDTQNVFGKEIDFYEKVKKFETVDEINVWIRNITLWMVNYLKEKKDIHANRAILQAKEFIKNNYNSKLNLKMVSDYVGLSESHFSSMFAKSTGMTFINYLNSFRIEKAKQLMTTTNLKIYEIASSVGYANVEHFSRVFKRVAGQSPNHFKPG
jgi:YesN/AraC family two-component response regulator